MKTQFLLVCLLLVCACSRAKDQWVLQAYDKARGYTFIKDGVEYHATCFAIGRPVLGLTSDAPPDTSPDAMPPEPVYDESYCSEILPYLHKPIPHFRLVGSVLLFTQVENNNFRLEFEIKDAK